MKKERKVLFLAISAAFIVPLSGSIYMPNLGAIEGEFGSSWMIPFTVTAYLFAQGLFQLIYGPFSDRFGRRYIYLPALSTYVLSSLLCYFSWSPGSLVLFRTLQGAAVASGFVVGAAVISDVYRKEVRGKAMGVFTAVPLFAPPIGSLLGGVIGSMIDWRAIFLFLTALGMIILSSFLILFPETLDKNETEGRSIISSMGELKKKNFASVTLLGLTMFGTMYTFLVFFSLILSDGYGFGTFYIGIFFTFYGVTNSLFAYIGGRLSDISSRRKVFLMGGAIGMLGSSTFSLLIGGPFYFLVISHILFGIGMGLATPSLLTYAVECSPGHTGSASGVYNFIRVMGASIIIAIGHTFIDIFSTSLLFTVCSVSILVSTVLAFYFTGEKNNTL